MPEKWADKPKSSTNGSATAKTGKPTSNKVIIIVTVVCVIVIIVVIGLVLGLAIGLTQNKSGDSVEETTKASLITYNDETTSDKTIFDTFTTVVITETTTTKSTTTRRQCKNAAIYDPASNKCMCKEFTSGDNCEIVANCEDLPDDYIGCEALAELEDIDEDEFAGYCPKTAFCKDKPGLKKIAARTLIGKNQETEFHLCQNHGIFDLKKSHCICQYYTYGEFCEYMKSCDELKEDPKECGILKNNLDEILFENLIPYCPKTFLCSSKFS